MKNLESRLLSVFNICKRYRGWFLLIKHNHVFSGLFVSSIVFVCASLLRDTKSYSDVVINILLAGSGATILHIGLFLKKCAEFIIYRNFFGLYAGTKPIYLVYPEFELNQEQGKNFNINRKIGCAVESHKRLIKWSYIESNIFIPSILASNDMEALIIVHSFLQSAGLNPVLKPVSALLAQNFVEECVISFGFTSNVYSKYCIDKCSDLISVVNSSSVNWHHDRKNEETHTKYKEFLLANAISKDDGKQHEYLFQSGDEWELGIICRYWLRPNDNPNERWFFCGGIGPFGTIGAARYFTESLFELNTHAHEGNFVAIVGVSVHLFPSLAPKLLVVLRNDGNKCIASEFNKEYWDEFCLCKQTIEI